jgi:hypothetical protein
MPIRPPRLPPLLARELEGLDWTLQPGRRHWHLRIEGELVAVLPFSRLRETPNRNNIHTRRAIRKFKENRK